MTVATITETFNVPVETFYKIITDYKAYPEFLNGVSAIDVLESDDNGAKVQYSINIIKKFQYTLKMIHKKPNKVTWTFDGGDLFSFNNGSWELKEAGAGKTEATYTLDLEFKVKVPKMIEKKLLSGNLPAMMKNYHDRAASL